LLRLKPLTAHEQRSAQLVEATSSTQIANLQLATAEVRPDLKRLIYWVIDWNTRRV